MNWLVWQLIDSAFPAGGFAHSGGLEAAVQQGQVSGMRALACHLRAFVSQAANGNLPLASAAHEAPGRLPELDAICDAFLSNHVANRASRSQGRTMLLTCSRAFPCAGIDDIAERARHEKLHRHHAPLFGAIFRALEIGLADAQRAFLYVVLRDLCSAAVRLGIAGPTEMQSIHRELSGDLDDVLLRCADRRADDIVQTAPLIDLFQANHDRIYSKLFQS